MSDTIDNGSGKCPVDLETRSLWGLWGGTNGGIEKGMEEEPKTAPGASSSSSSSSLPASLEEAAKHAQTPHPGQRLALSTHRLESTIPRSTKRGDNDDGSGSSSSPERLPAHQIMADTSTSGDASSDNWVYPSEQQVFNAMKRKGWKNVEEESIPSFLQIHNSVNERSWREVLKWEGGADSANEIVELSRFEGRPRDLSPKAWFLSTVGLRDRPFDRHDWYVVRTKKDAPSPSEGNSDNVSNSVVEKRYVLDFYMKADDPESGGLPRVEIDVRPALDSPSAFWQRGVGVLREVFPGIARECDDRFAGPR